MLSTVVAELRVLTSKDLDSRSRLCVALAGRRAAVADLG
jgi:hypothetical protein